MGPLLLKSFEKLFDGPIKTNISPISNDTTPVTWLDIVTYARHNAAALTLVEEAPGNKICQLWIRGNLVEISEDDYRLIISGAPERMIPTKAIPEDESAELGTLNILETRLAVLIKKADVVASKARQLNYHLKGRKTALLAKKTSELKGPEPESHTFSQPFSAVNARSPNPFHNEESKLQHQLLEQFLAQERLQNLPPQTLHPGRASISEGSGMNGGPPRKSSHAPTSTYEDEGQHRVAMAAKIEKLNRGDVVYPPCDRCRRLKVECTKHQTACQGCTKKHAKCSWMAIRDSELHTIPGAIKSGALGDGPPAPMFHKESGNGHIESPSESKEPTIRRKSTESLASEKERIEEHSLAHIASAAVASR